MLKERLLEKLKRELQKQKQELGRNPNVIIYGSKDFIIENKEDLQGVLSIDIVETYIDGDNIGMAKLSGRDENDYDFVLLMTNRESVASVYQGRLEMAGIPLNKIRWIYTKMFLQPKDKKTICILVSCRTDINSVTIPNPLYLPVRCGACYDNNSKSNVQGDDTGENISKLKPYFSEYTVQYWGWKNIDADYYGLCHYRRYLSFSDKLYPLSDRAFIMDPCLDRVAMDDYGLLDEVAMRSIIEENDAIINVPADVREICLSEGCMPTVYEHWKAHDGIFLDAKAIDYLITELIEVYPEYENYVLDYMHGYLHRGYNCYILKREIFYRLCVIQETIIKRLWPKFVKNGMLKQYPRTLAYLAEIIYGIYMDYLIKQKKYKILEKQLILFAETEYRPYKEGETLL